MSVVTETTCFYPDKQIFSGHSDSHHWFGFKCDDGKFRSICERKDAQSTRILDVLTDHIDQRLTGAYWLINQAIKDDLKGRGMEALIAS